MPTLGAALDLAKYEARNLRAHILGTAPSSPVTGQLYYNSADNTLYWWDSTAWVPAKSGPHTPIGNAGGDLTGTYPNPGIAPLVIVDGDVNGSAAIAESKLALATDAAAATGSRRTLGTGALQALPGSTRLDTITAPTTPVNLNNQRITTLADPSADTDGANKRYVDGVAAGLDAKASVRAATTANITLSGAQTVDTVPLTAGMRCLVKDQSTLAQNGLYDVQTGAWTRTTDADTWTELPGAFVFVEQGTVNADTGWVCSSDAGGTLGTTAVTWVQFSAAGQVIGGAGLTKTGITLDVGAGAGISVAADSVAIAANGVTNAMIADGAIDLSTADVTGVLPVAKGGTNAVTPAAARVALGGAGYYSSATHGAGTTITITAATHGLRATRGLVVQVQEEASGNVVLPDVAVAANGDVTVTFGASVVANAYRVTVVG